jgi:hydroxymethylpyrimidine pyrophosphatase-like HAD family hydrolase
MVSNRNVYTTAYNLGMFYLSTIKPSPNYAVMFDIDDTLLNTKNEKGIKPMIQLLHECNKMGIKVIIITARDSIHTHGTVHDLMKIGIYPNNGSINYDNIHYDYLYLRESPQDNNELFKSNVKQKYAKHGIYTIMSIGDNDIDIIGNYSGYAIKLPNIHDPRLFHKVNEKMVQVI